jgi:hypothetical protein
MMHRHLPIAIVALALAGSPGCGMLQSVPESSCATATPTIALAEMYWSDAVNWVDKAEARASTTDRLEDIAKAREALAVARKLIDTATDACKTVEIKSVFADFLALWSSLALARLSPSAGESAQQAPIVVLRLYRGAW